MSLRKLQIVSRRLEQARIVKREVSVVAWQCRGEQAAKLELARRAACEAVEALEKELYLLQFSSTTELQARVDADEAHRVQRADRDKRNAAKRAADKAGKAAKRTARVRAREAAAMLAFGKPI